MSLFDPALLADPARRREHYRQLVRSFYDSMSARYERVWGPSFHFGCFTGDESREAAVATAEKMVVEYGRFSAGMRVLDVGCGVGGPTLAIAGATAADIHGVDLSPINVARARQRAATRDPAVEFIVADAMALPFGDSSFDGLYEFEAGCHMPDPARFITECVRVLRPGARLVLFDWLAGGDGAPVGPLVEAVCRGFAIASLTTLARIAELVRNSGCDLIASRDLSAEGVIARNWEPLSRRALVSAGDPDQDGPVEWRFAESGRALWHASAAGALIIGLVVGEKQHHGRPGRR